MSWTTTSDIKYQVQRLWERQKLLASMVNGESLFPCRLGLRVPSSAEFADRFVDIRAWVDNLKKEDGKKYRIVWREINHRILGRNRVPKEVWVDSLDAALALIDKRAEANTFAELLETTRSRYPALLPWLEQHPLKALKSAGDWPRLLDVIDWLIARPCSGVYLRQIDVPGVHTKFIENNRGLLTELLDLTLPPESIHKEASGVANFCCRYGFRDKPLRIRFRILDPRHAFFTTPTDQDITISSDTFSRLNLPIPRVFITENEINFLAFPMMPGSLVVFGAGYGFEVLAQAAWLQECEVHYWGDIDTHGFAILDQLRIHFGHVRSFLMDRQTLLAHRLHWTTESTPQTRRLSRLNAVENELYDDLRRDRLGCQVRLEQERIGFSWLQEALNSLRDQTS